MYSITNSHPVDTLMQNMNTEPKWFFLSILGIIYIQPIGQEHRQFHWYIEKLATFSSQKSESTLS